MEKHLEDYKQQFCHELNSLITPTSFFTECEKNNVINTDDFLTSKAIEQLVEFCDFKESEEKIEAEFETDIARNSPEIAISASKIIKSPHYIPPCRLLNISEGIGDEIIDRVVNKEFDVFGMTVLLCEDKSFIISLIFGKYKVKTYI
ncbi:hypothetical protein CDIK_0788 [Cucumispora dikerogammari]|nr:hypothetical protein CDIK_0788 [Cucumispora dikerogammari]